MNPVLIMFATKEGHTRRVAEHIAAAIRGRGIDAVLSHIEDADAIDLSRFSSAILAASVHVGKHEKEMVSFARDHRQGLEDMPTAFLSVSMSQAGAEDESASADKRAEAAKRAADQMESFFEETSWHPDRATGVAGALMYSKYNILVRWMMKRIARKEGRSTDTSSDHVYTDWDALDGFVDQFVAGLKSAETASA